MPAENIFQSDVSKNCEMFMAEAKTPKFKLIEDKIIEDKAQKYP